jgi:hypothetical protein
MAQAEAPGGAPEAPEARAHLEPGPGRRVVVAVFALMLAAAGIGLAVELAASFPAARKKNPAKDQEAEVSESKHLHIRVPPTEELRGKSRVQEDRHCLTGSIFARKTAVLGGGAW